MIRTARRSPLPWLCGLLFIVATAVARAEQPAATAVADWPQFLGPTRNGLSPETGLLDSWPAGGLKPVWRVPGGVGMSGMAVAGERLVTLVQQDGQQWLVAHNTQTGQRQWRTALAPEYLNSMGNGPRGTPAISGDRVFAFTGEGILAAVRLADGQLEWKHDVVRELKGKPAEYGMASSPLVVGNRVLVLVGAPGATVAAYDTATGKLAWTGGEDPASYSSPVYLEVGGRRQVVVAAGTAILGLDPDSGVQLWRYPYVTDFHCNIAVPLAVEGRVFVSAGENHGCVLLGLEPSGQKLQVREVWSSLGPKSVLRNEWQTSLLIDGHLYGMDNVGGAGPVTHLTCIRAATGERVWQQVRYGKGNLIAADGKLFITTMAGELVVARATPRGYEELGRSTVCGPTRQSASLARGRLYLRDDTDIVCVDVRRP